MTEFTFTGWTIFVICLIIELGFSIAVIEGLERLVVHHQGFGLMAFGLAVLAFGVFLAILVGGSMLVVNAP